MGDSPPIVVDSREKRPWDFPGMRTVEDTLNVGDYTYEGFEDCFAVERKSLNDLATSVGSERDRFEAEIRRAQTLQEFIVLIEAPKSHVYDYAGQSNSPKYYSRIHPNSVIGTLDSWPDKYANLDFEFCGNRIRARDECLAYLDKWYLEYNV